MIDNKTKKWINPWFLVSVGTLFFSGLVILFLWKRIPPQIPWFYSLPWGENQLMSKSGLLIVLVSAVVVLFLGNMLSQWTKKEDKIVEQTVTVSLAFICLMLVVSVFKVLLIFI